MEENVQSLFTEEEWNVLKERGTEICRQMKELPLHIKVPSERMGKENE